MLPALSSRHRHAPFFLPAFPSRVSLLLGLGVEQGSKNPGTSTKAPKPCSALHGDPLSPSRDPTREGRMDTPHESPSLPQSSPATTVLPGPSKVPREARPSGTRDLAPHPVSVFPPHGTVGSCTLRPSLAPRSRRPRRTKFNFAGSAAALGPRWGGSPRRDREGPSAYLSHRASPPTGVADARAARCQRRLRQAGGVLLRASPRSHLPPSGESPRAGPRARQCARAALPSTAGGGGDAAGGGAEQGARRCPRRPCSPPAAVPRGRSCVRASRLGDRPRGNPEDHALGAPSAKTGEVPSCGGA